MERKNTVMKLSHKQHLIAAALAGALSLTSAPAQTPDSVQTRIGTLNFERGYPTPETVRKIYDEMDFQRTVQAYLWAFPAVSFESIRVGLKQGIGVNYNEVALADNFVDTKGVWLTANDTTIYGLANINLGQAGPNGPENLWVRFPASKVLVNHAASFKKEPPIRPGTPDPYVPKQL